MPSRSRTDLNGSGEKRASQLALKTYAALALMVILGPAGDVLLSTGMRRTAPGQWTAAGVAAMAARAIGSGTVWLGLLCLVAYVITEMVVLSWADYSYVQPASAASYAVVALLGSAVLGEDVSSTRWLGVAVICIGVLLVGRTPPQTTETASP
jgi:drug/metabolite transporter (DMT)-like permease